MGLFQRTQDTVIVHDRGTFKQLDVYTWDGFIFAKLGNGFIRLNADGSTSKPSISIRQLQWTGQIARDVHGRLALPSTEGTQPIADPLKLLGAK